MLERLVNEIELLGRSEARFGVSARVVIGTLIADYLYGTFDIVEPPIPSYPAYVWPEGKQTFE